VHVGACDTGRLENLPVDRFRWLLRVDGEPDPIGPVLPDGASRIAEYKGHGTFVAGIITLTAPQVEVFVTNTFTWSGANLESAVIADLDGLADRDPRPDLINLSAGMYTRNDLPSIGFEVFRQRRPDLVLVAPAGNDSTQRPFHPACTDWAFAVGALGADQHNRAWFSNFGDHVDAYALGEGLVNVYATGVYLYQEPPKRPARQRFDGLARWSGTSFSAAMVTGLIAARMARHPELSAAENAAAVRAFAREQAVNGLPVLYAHDEP